jgi:alpha-galactosidase
VRTAHPEVEIESCASGGGRADWGILSRTHRVWTSDGTDPLTRVGIQRGFLRFNPPEVMGAHVSASPNHQTGRSSTLAFRAIVAMTGHFGLELDPLALSDSEREELRAWIALHKRLRPVFHGPASRAHELPEQNGRRGWFSVDKDTDRSVAVLVQERQQDTVHAPPLRLTPPGRHKARQLSAPAPQRPGCARTTPVLDDLLAGSLVVGDDELSVIGLALPELPPQSGLVIEIEPLDH